MANVSLPDELPAKVRRRFVEAMARVLARQILAELRDRSAPPMENLAVVAS
jgi:hypothetical protein